MILISLNAVFYIRHFSADSVKFKILRLFESNMNIMACAHRMLKKFLHKPEKILSLLESTSAHTKIRHPLKKYLT